MQRVLHPRGIVDQRAVGFGIDGVQREVAALRVLSPVGREGDGGAAAIGRDVAAQRGDLEGLVVGEDPEEDAKWFRVTKGGISLITEEMVEKWLAAR